MRSTICWKYSGKLFSNELRLMMYTMKAICATTARRVSCAARRTFGHLMFLPWERRGKAAAGNTNKRGGKEGAREA